MTIQTSLPLNCRLCGKPVQYHGIVRDVHVYNCTTDGRMCLRQDGRFGPPEGVERLFATYVRDDVAFANALEKLNNLGDES